LTEQSPPQPNAAARRSAVLRRNAAQRAERTVARLQDAIAALTRAGLPITGPLIKRETGLDYKTIQRNPAAYALFCKHASHFTQPRTPKSTTKRTGKRRRNMTRASAAPQPTPRDPLLERPKRRLVDRIRILEGENAELMQAAARQALHQQEIEALNMNLRSCLVAAQRDLRSLVAEYSTGRSSR
jgi:hypothetical protein